MVVFRERENNHHEFAIFDNETGRRLQRASQRFLEGGFLCHQLYFQNGGLPFEIEVTASSGTSNCGYNSKSADDSVVYAVQDFASGKWRLPVDIFFNSVVSYKSPPS